MLIGMAVYSLLVHVFLYNYIQDISVVYWLVNTPLQFIWDIHKSINSMNSQQINSNSSEISYLWNAWQLFVLDLPCSSAYRTSRVQLITNSQQVILSYLTSVMSDWMDMEKPIHSNTITESEHNYSAFLCHLLLHKSRANHKLVNALPKHHSHFSLLLSWNSLMPCCDIIPKMSNKWQKIDFYENSIVY